MSNQIKSNRTLFNAAFGDVASAEKNPSQDRLGGVRISPGTWKRLEMLEDVANHLQINKKKMISAPCGQTNTVVLCQICFLGCII